MLTYVGQFKKTEDGVPQNNKNYTQQTESTTTGKIVFPELLSSEMLTYISSQDSVPIPKIQAAFTFVEAQIVMAITRNILFSAFIRTTNLFLEKLKNRLH